VVGTTDHCPCPLVADMPGYSLGSELEIIRSSSPACGQPDILSRLLTRRPSRQYFSRHAPPYCEELVQLALSDTWVRRKVTTSSG